MKALALITCTSNCEPLWRSLACLGHDVTVQRYDDRPRDRHGELVEQAKALQPDIIVYIGAQENAHSQPVPSPDILCRLNDVAPMILLCGDAGDEGWWPYLQLYHDRECFTLFVGIDGSFDTPLARYDNAVVALTPVDPSFFPYGSWSRRDVQIGTTSGSRMLRQVPGVTFERTATYERMCAFLSRCRVVINDATTGGGHQKHVKGRVIEAGFAGAVLFELAGAPTSCWFECGKDYLEYESPDDVERLLREHGDIELMAMAIRFHVKVAVHHHPTVFWEKVLRKVLIHE